jgi:hypothetical protein
VHRFVSIWIRILMLLRMLFIFVEFVLISFVRETLLFLVIHILWLSIGHTLLIVA